MSFKCITLELQLIVFNYFFLKFTKILSNFQLIKIMQENVEFCIVLKSISEKKKSCGIV